MKNIKNFLEFKLNEELDISDEPLNDLEKSLKYYLKSFDKIINITKQASDSNFQYDFVNSYEKTFETKIASGIKIKAPIKYKTKLREALSDFYGESEFSSSKHTFVMNGDEEFNDEFIFNYNLVKIV